MSVSSFRVCSVIAFLLVALAPLSAEEWMHGAVAVTSVTGEVLLEEVGGQSTVLHPTDSFPRYLSGLLKLRTQSKAGVFLNASNQMSIYHEGPGFFALERFEQEVAGPVDYGTSRMILNFRQGLLAVDNRELSANSQLIVETPLGRISARDGWWYIKIGYDPGNQMYDFSIQCRDGFLRYTHPSGATYVLRAGQRLFGVGALAHVSIEVAEIADDGSDCYQQFAKMAADASQYELTAEMFRSKMNPLQHFRNTRTVTPNSAGVHTAKRPLLIEYSPQAKPVTPFRAVIISPSTDQADVF
jgi:hypothetical protein